MKKSLLVDKTFYVLIGILLVSNLLLAGCSSTDENGVVVPEEGTTVQDTPQQSSEDSTVENSPQTGEDKTSEESTVPGSKPEPSSSAPASGQNSSQEASAPEEIATVYADGTYASTASYQTPAGAETVQVQLTVENDVVTGLTVTNQAADPTSKNFQDLFILGINSLVVGKSLDSLTAFSAVNGSSLTPIGFNAALVTVKAQARVQAS